MTDQDTDANHGETQSTASRWWLTNDVAALILVGGFVGLVALNAGGAVDLRAVPLELRLHLTLISGVATAWLFGGGAVKAWQSVQGGT